MNLLASLLPGVRELRTPLVIGVLWLLTIVLALSPDAKLLVLLPDSVQALSDLLRDVPPSFLWIGALVPAYLLGSVLMGLSEGFLRHVSTRLLNLIAAIVRGLDKARNGRRYGKHGFQPGQWTRMWPSLLEDVSDVASVRGPVIDYVSNEYTRVGAPSFAAMAFPVEALIEQLDVTALQVWSKEPAQYQEYDRLGAEADFRAGVGLPLLALGICASIQTGAQWVAIPLTLIAVLTLARQSISLRRKQRVLMANALYLGMAESQPLSGVVDGLAALLEAGKLTKDDSWGTWWAATAVVFSRRSEYELENAVLHEVLTISDEDELDAATQYLLQHNPESGEFIGRERAAQSNQLTASES